MAQIGTFTRTQHGFTGRLRTLSLDIELTLVPAEHSDTENAPTTVFMQAMRTDRRSARAGAALEIRPANMSRCRSTIPPSHSRSAPTCSSPAATVPHSICSGRVHPDARAGADRCRRCSKQALACPSRMSHLFAIPLFAEKPAHSSVPLSHQAAVARSGGQERPKAGACALLLTAASTAARFAIRRDGEGYAASAFSRGGRGADDRHEMTDALHPLAQAERAANSTSVVSRSAPTLTRNISPTHRAASIFLRACGFAPSCASKAQRSVTRCRLRAPSA